MPEITRFGNITFLAADITGTRVPSGMGIALRPATVLFATVSADHSWIRVFSEINTHVTSFFPSLKKMGCC